MKMTPPARVERGWNHMIRKLSSNLHRLLTVISMRGLVSSLLTDADTTSDGNPLQLHTNLQNEEEDHNVFWDTSSHGIGLALPT